MATIERSATAFSATINSQLSINEDDDLGASRINISAMDTGVQLADGDAENNVDAVPPELTRLIDPWPTVQHGIQSTIDLKLRSRPGTARRTAAPAERPDLESMMALPVTIPTGVRPGALLIHPQPTLKSALVLPASSLTYRDSDSIMTLDSMNIYWWRGEQRIRKMPTALLEREEDSKADLPPTTVHAWLYIQRLRLLILSTSRLLFKVYDQKSMTEISTTHSHHAVLSMEYLPDREEVVALSLGAIRIWRLERVVDTKHDRIIHVLTGPRLVINDPSRDAWFHKCAYNRSEKKLFTVCETDMVVFNVDTGARVASVSGIHEPSTTCIAHYEPAASTVTGGKDGVIKVWNNNCMLMHRFHDHKGDITGLLLIKDSGFAPKTEGIRDRPTDLPFLFSCSTDCTLRMWNIDTGYCIYRVETNKPCLGVMYMRKNTLLTVLPDCVRVWNLHHSQTMMIFTRSQITTIKRVPAITLPNGKRQPARVVTVSEDGAIRVLNCITGVTLTIAFPIYKNALVRDVLYNPGEQHMYAYLSNSETLVFDASTNPCRVLENWPLCDMEAADKYEMAVNGMVNEYDVDRFDHRQPLASLVALDLHSVPNIDANAPRFWILAGAVSGQLLHINHKRRGKQEILVQAHSASVSCMEICSHSGILGTAARDTVRIWSIQVVYGSNQNRNDLTKSRVKSSEGKRWRIVPTLLATLTPPVPPLMVPVGLTVQPETSHVMIAYQKRDIDAEHIVPSSSHLGDFPVIVMDWESNKSKPLRVLEENHVGPITRIISLTAFGLHASCSLDRTIKIWDSSENTLVRELVFTEPVRCLAFLNDRGDLLVGLQDGVVLYRMQDYLPAKNLIESTRRLFVDDEIEMPTLFNADLAFWSRLYHLLTATKRVLMDDSAKALFGIATVRHHLDNTERDAKVTQRREKLNHFRVLQTYDEMERSVFERAKAYEPVLTHTHWNFSGVSWDEFREGMEAFFPPESLAALKEQHQDLTNREILLRLFNQASRLERRSEEDGGVPRAESPHRRRSTLKTALPPIRNRVNSPTNMDLTDDSDLVRLKRRKHLQIINENSDAFSSSNRPKQTLAINDVAMPTAIDLVPSIPMPVFKPETSPPKEPTGKREHQMSIREKLGSVVYAVLPNSLEFALRSVSSADETYNQILMAKVPFNRRKSRFPSAIEEEEEEMEVEKSKAASPPPKFKPLRYRRQETPSQIPEASEENTEAQQNEWMSRSTLRTGETRTTDGPSRFGNGNKESSRERIDDEDAYDDDGNPVYANGTRRISQQKQQQQQQQQQLQKQQQQKQQQQRRDANGGVSEFDEKGRRSVRIQEPNGNITVPSQGKTSVRPPGSGRQRSGAGTLSSSQDSNLDDDDQAVYDPFNAASADNGAGLVNLTLRPNSGQDKLKRRKHKSRLGTGQADGSSQSLTDSSTDSLENGYEDGAMPARQGVISISSRTSSAKYRDANAVMAPLNGQSGSGRQSASRLGSASGSLTAAERAQAEKALLEPIMNAPWFPKAAIKPGVRETSMSIFDRLLKLLLAADTEETVKVETSKALLYIYHSFHGDFSDPVAQVICPQHQVFQDESWAVRAQMCANMVGYDMNIVDVLRPLIQRLADDNASVKHVATASLMYYGIDCKAKLQDAMIRCGLMDASQVPPSSSPSSRNKNGVSQLKDVRDWLKSTPAIGYRTFDIDGNEVSVPDEERRRPSTQPAKINQRLPSYVQTLVAPIKEAAKDDHHVETAGERHARHQRTQSEGHRLQRRYSLQGGRIYPDYLKESEKDKPSTRGSNI